MVRKKEPNDYSTGIPLHEAEALTHVLLPEIQTLFEREEEQRESAQWKSQRGMDKIEPE